MLNKGSDDRTPRHKVKTIERGRTAAGRIGFAAWCAEPGCDAITFGGFDTRSAARQALDGHESSPHERVAQASSSE